MSPEGCVTLGVEGMLTELCGVNDENLTAIEELLDVRVYSKGNQLYLDTKDEAARQVFTRMIRELEKHTRSGEALSPDLVRAIHAGVAADDDGRIELLRRVHISVTGGYSRIFPRTAMQAEYIKAIQDGFLTFGIGPAGTGKTFLAVACALEEVMARRRRKLILTRPVVEAGESLGFLPGDLTQKLNPYLRPLYDAMEAIIPHELVGRLQENGVIEIAPLAYMRGRSLKNCVIILDEAQNTTREQMKMFLTRMGEDSKTIVTGDVTQIDLPRKQSSGLVHVSRLLEGIKDIRFTRFGDADVVRNPLVQKIIKAYESDEDA